MSIVPYNGSIDYVFYLPCIRSMSYAIDIFSKSGTKQQQVLLDAIFSDDAINETLVHEYVVMYLANQRQNTAKAKSRGEIV